MASPSYLLIIVIMHIISIKKLTFITVAPGYKNMGERKQIIQIISSNIQSFCSQISFLPRAEIPKFISEGHCYIFLLTFLSGSFPTSWSFSQSQGSCPLPKRQCGTREQFCPCSCGKACLAHELRFHIGSFVHGLQASSSILTAITAL